MIAEITAAVSIASRAFNLVQGAVAKGHEVNDLMQQIGKFYSAKDTILELETKHANTSAVGKLLNGSSVEAEALAIVSAKYRANELEIQRREMIMIYGPGEQFYIDMMRERSRIRQARMNAVRAAAERRRFIIDLFGFGFIGAILLFCIVAILGVAF